MFDTDEGEAKATSTNKTTKDQNKKHEDFLQSPPPLSKSNANFVDTLDEEADFDIGSNDITFSSQFLEHKDERDEENEEGKDDEESSDGGFLPDLEQLSAEIEDTKRKYDSRARGLLSVDGKTINEVNDQVQYLLGLFGVPYVCSPSEADAQCAYLNSAGLVDAVVSDDVDVFLFGAQTVYRYLFSMSSLMEEYTAEEIKGNTGLMREDLQKLALFLGSDYTIGIHGVGRVHALEIITAFPDLTEFKRWCHGDSPGVKVPDILGKGIVGLRPFLKVPDSFPPRAVLDAYQRPRVDEIEDQFEWKRPDIDGLRKFAVLYFGWPVEKTDKALQPVIVRAAMMGSVPQSPSAKGIADIRDFFLPQDNGKKEKEEIGFAKGSEIPNKLSKRIREIYAIKRKG